MAIYRIVVFGRPAPQGSKKFVGLDANGHGIMVESSKYLKPWRKAVREAAEAAIANGSAQPLLGPIHCRMVFTLARPDAEPKTRITWPDSVPDLSKLVRATEDALTESGIWEDDARVIDCESGKRYPNEGIDALHRPGCVIELRSAAEMGTLFG